MATKKFLASVTPNNSIRVYDAISHQLHRIISVDGTISSQPTTNGNVLSVNIQKDNQQFTHNFALPNGNLIDKQHVKID